MGQLFLSGGGNHEQTADITHRFSQVIDWAKPLLYVPLAGDPTFRSYNESHNYIKKTFQEFGIHNVFMCTDLNNIQDLHNFGGIYFSGGDPIQLIDKVIASGFDKALKDYYLSDGIIYGQSAGAVIFGEHILSIDKQSSQPGLHFINHYSICCHYNKSQGLALKHFVYKTNDRVIALPEGTALHFSGTDYQVIGEQSPYIIEKINK